MDLYVKRILRKLREEDASITYLEQISWPVWIRNSEWTPSLVFTTAGKFITVEIARSGSVPHILYREVLSKLLQDHDNLKIIVCLPRAIFEKSPDTANFCHSLGIEVRLVGFGLGLDIFQPVPFPLRPEELARPFPHGIGQFPQPILERATGLNRLLFADVLNNFVTNISQCNDSDTDTLILIKRTVDTLLQSHPHFRAKDNPFLRLVSFEKLLLNASIDTSDHVFHSFRVFLAGCPIINQFYDQFKQSTLKFTNCPQEDVFIEYIWLLTALFHDSGRSKVSLKPFLSQTMQDDDLIVTSKTGRWEKVRYREANRILRSLGAFMASRSEGVWDGGTFDDEDGINLGAEWTGIYDGLDIHGIISAYDFLSDTYDNMTAAGERNHRPFMISHAPLAALAMLLHDWRLWEKAKKWRLIPVDISRNPLAALLIYIDTWDDYRRKVGDPDITIVEYEVNSEGARVVVEWENAAALQNQEKKYNSFRESIRGGPPHFWIETRTR